MSVTHVLVGRPSQGKRKVAVTFLIVFLVVAVAAAGMAALSWMAPRPGFLGVHDGRLADCPDSPNCVCTQADDTEHWIEPLIVQADPEVAMDQIKQVVMSTSGSRIIEQSAVYLYAEFRTPIFRFVDDVEFLLDAESGRIHFRSASRVGYSDMGVNRARMETIRRRFSELQTSSRATPRDALLKSR